MPISVTGQPVLSSFLGVLFDFSPWPGSQRDYILLFPFSSFSTQTASPLLPLLFFITLHISHSPWLTQHQHPRPEADPLRTRTSPSRSDSPTSSPPRVIQTTHIPRAVAHLFFFKHFAFICAKWPCTWLVNQNAHECHLNSTSRNARLGRLFNTRRQQWQREKNTTSRADQARFDHRTQGDQRSLLQRLQPSFPGTTLFQNDTNSRDTFSFAIYCASTTCSSNNASHQQ